MAVDLKDYGYTSNVGQLGQIAAAGERMQNESDLREKALAMAIDYHRSHDEHGDVAATAAKFLAFLKGGPDV